MTGARAVATGYFLVLPAWLDRGVARSLPPLDVAGCPAALDGQLGAVDHAGGGGAETPAVALGDLAGRVRGAHDVPRLVGRGPLPGLALLELDPAALVGHAVAVVDELLGHLNPLVGQVLLALVGLDLGARVAVAGVVGADRGAGTAGARRVLRPDRAGDAVVAGGGGTEAEDRVLEDRQARQ